MTRDFEFLLNFSGGNRIWEISGETWEVESVPRSGVLLVHDGPTTNDNFRLSELRSAAA